MLGTSIGHRRVLLCDLNIIKDWERFHVIPQSINTVTVGIHLDSLSCCLSPEAKLSPSYQKKTSTYYFVCH